jgi:hypothetical protein
LFFVPAVFSLVHGRKGATATKRAGVEDEDGSQYLE